MSGIPSGNNVPSGGNIPSGGNVVSGNNVPSTATGLVMPGSPIFGFSAANFDASNNSTMVDAQALSLWKNLGSAASGDASQATGSSQAAFRLVAVSGKINNKSAAECVDAGRSIVTAAITSIPQPYTVVSVVRQTKAATQVYFSGSTGPTEMYASTTTDHLNCGSDVDTGMTAPANQFNLRVASINGASSYLRLNGVQSANVNPGSNALAGTLTLMRDVSSLGIIGFFVELWIYAGVPGGAAPSAAALEAPLTSFYGAFPQ